MSDLVQITSRPWDGIILGDCGPYQDAHWHQIYATAFDGSSNRGPLFQSAGDFSVSTTSPVSMAVTVATGTAFVGGLWGQNLSARTLTVAANGGGATRYDLVFLHWRRATQDLRIRIVDGTAATCAAAVPPAANAIGTYQVGAAPVTEWAVPLACIKVIVGATEIQAADITDMREFCRYRTAAGDIADGTSITTAAATSNDTGEVLTVAAGGVGIAEINATIAGTGVAGGSGVALSVDAADTVAGAGLSGTGAILAINAGTGLEVSGDALRIAAAAAGNGLSGGGGAALAVNVDASTIVIAADILSVGSISNTKITDRIRRVWVGANEMHVIAAGGATWGTLAGMPAQAEGWLFSPGVNEYVIGRLTTPADFYLSSPSAGYLYFVWAHALGAGGPFTVWWHVIYDRMNATKYVLCGHPLVGGTAMQAWAKANNEVTVATANLRKVAKSAEQLTGLSVGAVNYLDFEIGRNAGNPADDYAGDVLLLGFYYDYLADM